MVSVAEPVRINRSVIEQLTIDAMLLADEAESYFGCEEFVSADMPAELQVEFACEAFRTTATLRQLIERLTQPALVGQPLREVISPLLSDQSRLPPKARAIVAATRALFDRVVELERQRMDAGQEPPPSPARLLQDRLEASLRA